MPESAQQAKEQIPGFTPLTERAPEPQLSRAPKPRQSKAPGLSPTAPAECPPCPVCTPCENGAKPFAAHSADDAERGLRTSQTTNREVKPSSMPDARASISSGLAAENRQQQPAVRQEFSPAENEGAAMQASSMPKERSSLKGADRRLVHALNLHGFSAEWQRDHVLLRLGTDEYIDYESSEVTELGRKQLDELADVLQEFFIEQMTVEGHTDSWGEIDTNVIASTARAEIIARELAARGIGGAVEVAGRGEAFPLATNNTLEGRSRNRRVELLIW